MSIADDQARQAAAVRAIQRGELETLRRLLRETPELARARVGDPGQPGGESRTLLHVATDWPGHFPEVAATIRALVEAGADPNARFVGRHEETPLHWAASSDDVAALDALLDAGADIEAPGSVIGGGSPLADAVAFGQWKAARRLVERGARANLWQAAGLGLLERLEECLSDGAEATSDSGGPTAITKAFWAACHGGQLRAAERLLGRGADVNWVGYDHRSPLDVAERGGVDELVTWLRERGARSARESR